MKSPLPHNVSSAMLIACSLSLGWLAVAVLPIALYQYFAFSPLESLGGVFTAAWSGYFAPLALIRWTPTLSSVDPLVTLIPTFALLFALWSGVLFLIVFGWKRLRRAA